MQNMQLEKGPYLADLAKDINVLFWQDLDRGRATNVLLRNGNTGLGIVWLLDVVRDSATGRQGIDGSEGTRVLVTRPGIRAASLCLGVQSK